MSWEFKSMAQARLFSTRPAQTHGALGLLATYYLLWCLHIILLRPVRLLLSTCIWSLSCLTKAMRRSSRASVVGCVNRAHVIASFERLGSKASMCGDGSSEKLLSRAGPAVTRGLRPLARIDCNVALLSMLVTQAWLIDPDLIVIKTVTSACFHSV